MIDHNPEISETIAPPGFHFTCSCGEGAPVRQEYDEAVDDMVKHLEENA